MDELEQARKTIEEADEEISRAFQKRMAAVKAVGLYKKANGLPVENKEREKALLEKELGEVDDEFKDSYAALLESEIAISKRFQRNLMNSEDLLYVEAENPYPIVFKKGSLGQVKQIFGLPENATVVVLSDDGVPSCHKKKLLSGFEHPLYYEFHQGEINKNIEVLQGILAFLAENRVPRDAYLITLGGGVVGDMGGFASSIYMRGIKWINIPTTLLSQVDSSIGGKTAIDFGGAKNIVGAFYNPIGVLIDVDVLATLDVRQTKAGLVEAIKMAATFDEEFFRYFETTPFEDLDFEKVVRRALELKKYVVEKDPKESHLRKTLNFGHTIGHGYEIASKGSLLHGEAVGLGMLVISQGEARSRILSVLSGYELPVSYLFGKEEALEAIQLDKKKGASGYSVVICPKIGEYEIQNVQFDLIKRIVLEGRI